MVVLFACSTLLDFKKKLYGTFLWMGFNCLKATATSRRQFTFYHSVPRNSWYSLYRPRKDERLSRPWSYPVVLNTGLLDWESSTLNTRLLLLNLCKICEKYQLNEVHARGTFAVCPCVNMEHPTHAFKQYEKLAKYQRLERKLYKSENELKSTKESRVKPNWKVKGKTLFITKCIHNIHYLITKNIVNAVMNINSVDLV